MSSSPSPPPRRGYGRHRARRASKSSYGVRNPDPVGRHSVSRSKAYAADSGAGYCRRVCPSRISNRSERRCHSPRPRGLPNDGRMFRAPLVVGGTALVADADVVDSLLGGNGHREFSLEAWRRRPSSQCRPRTRYARRARRRSGGYTAPAGNRRTAVLLSGRPVRRRTPPR